MGWIASSSSVAATTISENAGRSLNLVAVALYPLLLGGAIFNYEKDRTPSVSPWRSYLTTLLVSYLLLAAYGVVIGNAFRVIALDTVTLATVFGAFFLGRRDQVWEDAKTPVILLTAASILFSLLYTDSYVLVDRGILNTEIGSQFETGLVLAPLFCLATLADRKRWRYYVFLLLSAGCLFVYLYFGRRGISTRCAIEIFLAAVVLPISMREMRNVFVATAIMGVFAGTLLLYFPFDTLIGRFTGSYGVIDTITVDNERLIERQLLMDEFSVWEMMVGRGIGGAFLINQEKTFVLDKIDADRSGRIVLHAGAWFPFLKGGLFFQMIYFLPLFFLFSAFRRWRSLDPISKAALLAGCVLFPFQFIEGSPTYSTPWVAFGIGLILARAQNVRAIMPRVNAPSSPRTREGHASSTS